MIVLIRTACRWASVGVALILAGCSNQSATVGAGDADVDYCGNLEQVIGNYNNQFADIRFNRKAGRITEVWETRFQAVGSHCEIWSWGQGQASYVCTKAFPDKTMATDVFARVKAKIRSCVGDAWALTESDRKVGEGTKAVFRNGGSLPVVSSHIVSTPGLFKDEWSVYLFVGDPNDQL